MKQITAPTLLIDEEKCRNNIRRMAGKAKRHGLDLKPHMKTHQSADIGNWFREEGIDKATVSSVAMAEYFFRHGWTDLTIAFPFNIRETERIRTLVEQGAKLSLIVNNAASASALNSGIKQPVRVYTEIDTGAGRTGYPASQKTKIRRQIETISRLDNLRFTGFYSHAGHSYAARSVEEIVQIHRHVLEQMRSLKKEFRSLAETVKVCIGDTPCCSKADDFTGIDEISPGNFVFFDLTQVQIGSCDYDDIAVAMAAPVVEVYPTRRQIAVHGGAVHFSKDRLATGGEPYYGTAVELDEEGWSRPLPDCKLSAISQEHGILSCSKKLLETLEPGDLIGILPVHSCLTADLMGSYTTFNGTHLSHMRNDK